MEPVKQTWSIFLFCYQDESTVEQLVEDTQQVLNKISPEKNEIIIVDDGSVDETLERAQSIAEKYNNVKVISHPVNKGTGYALRSGYDAARYENVCGVSGDGQFDVEELLPFAEIQPDTFVSFYRKEKTGYSLIRKLLSLSNQMINLLFLGIKLKDVNWTNAYKTEDLKKLDIKLTSALVESEISCKLIRHGYRVIQVPSVYHRRRSGVSTAFSRKITIQALLELGKLIKVVRK